MNRTIGTPMSEMRLFGMTPLDIARSDLPPDLELSARNGRHSIRDSCTPGGSGTKMLHEYGDCAIDIGPGYVQVRDRPHGPFPEGDDRHTPFF
jgi:hypothetical protein